jgi:hypothetical protein
MTPTDEVPLDPSLEGLAALVSGRMIWGHLVNRPPGLLDPGSDDFDTIIDHVRAIAAEVTLSARCPLIGDVRDLAVAAVAIGVARNIEESMFPEQGIGDDSRAEQLERRFLALLRLLDAACGGGTTGDGPGWSGSIPYRR